MTTTPPPIPTVFGVADLTDRRRLLVRVVFGRDVPPHRVDDLFAIDDRPSFELEALAASFRDEDDVVPQTPPLVSPSSTESVASSTTRSLGREASTVAT